VLERFKLKLTHVMTTATKKKQRPTINTCFMLVAPTWPEDVFKASSSASGLPNRSKTLQLTNQPLKDR